MELLKLENITFLIIFFLPGFISVKIYHLIVSEERYDFSKNLLEIVGFSLLNLILNSWVIYQCIDEGWLFSESWELYAAMLWIIVVMPACYPYLVRYFLRNPRFKRYFVSSQKSSWDYYFSQKKPAWVIIYLKDGRKIAGVYSTASFASGYPNKESIYIEEVWKIDANDNFVNSVPQSDGALVLCENITSIEFFN